MPSAGFFRALGMFTRPAFFSDAECDRLLGAAQRSPQLAVTVDQYQWGEAKLDEQTRRTRRAELSGDDERFIVERLREAMPNVAAHFGLTLTNVEQPQLLTYRTGDFFVLHRDLDRDEVSGRQISAIAFLESPGEATYGGGALRFFTDRGTFPFSAERGMLLAFRSDIFHDVEPVTRGERHTVVSWFL